MGEPMRLAAVQPNMVFLYNGERHSIDLNGRAGSGNLPVVNLKTKERFSLKASTEVKEYKAREEEFVAEESIDVDVPGPSDSLTVEPEIEYTFPEESLVEDTTLDSSKYWEDYGNDD